MGTNRVQDIRDRLQALEYLLNIRITNKPYERLLIEDDFHLVLPLTPQATLVQLPHFSAFFPFLRRKYEISCKDTQIF